MPVATRVGEQRPEELFQVGFAPFFSNGFRVMLNQLSETDLLRFRDEHLANIETYASKQGIWLDVQILLSVSYKHEGSL